MQLLASAAQQQQHSAYLLELLMLCMKSERCTGSCNDAAAEQLGAAAA
jgi:hypothetical protein